MAAGETCLQVPDHNEIHFPSARFQISRILHPLVILDSTGLSEPLSSLCALPARTFSHCCVELLLGKHVLPHLVLSHLTSIRAPIDAVIATHI